ncbi:MAG: HAMP domain-containing sensor histidine kinase [Desulfobacterales bacterium]|jgi:signal transduction histidine kinase
MNSPRWVIHPILIFLLSIAALGLSLFLYIYWYMEANIGLRSVIERFNLDRDQVLASQTWTVILVLSLLVGIILMGIFGIFVYGQKTLQLYRLQNNFINNFTHELKTPVTSLKLFLQTFSKHELARADQLRYIQFMISDVARLTENINRILNLARIESKSYANEFVDTNLITAMNLFISNNKHLFQNGNIRIHPPEGELPSMRVNLPLFDMLLMNLLTNAVKYNYSPQPIVDVGFEIHPRKLIIRFADNGIGIEKKELRKIFRKFYQVGRAEDMSAKGSGLGLYLVQSIARIHKWKVEAHSQGIGKGSTFSLTLPV